jgi:hypothetical protein
MKKPTHKMTMKKPEFPCYSGINAPSFNTIDAVQNQRLDMLKEVDRKHDRQFNAILVYSFVVLIWLMALTAVEVVK